MHQGAEGYTSPETAAEAVYQAFSVARHARNAEVFNRSVDSSFVVLGGEESQSAPDWGELSAPQSAWKAPLDERLLPFVGPEVWRIAVPNVTRAVQGHPVSIALGLFKAV